MYTHDYNIGMSEMNDRSQGIKRGIGNTLLEGTCTTI